MDDAIDGGTPPHGEVVFTAFDVLQQYIEGKMQYIEG